MLAGHVSVGPFCPVEIEGQECPPPPGIYESIEIVVSALAGGTDRLVITARPDAEGRFELRLPAGDYRVRLEHSIGIGGAPPEVQAVHVDAGATTTIAFDVDTGIR